ELENTVRLSDVENQAMNPTAPILDYSEDHEFVSANKLDDYYSQEDKNDAKEAEKHRLTKGMAQRTEIQEFYKDQCVFLTGGTGFLGKVLIEKLLRSCKDIDTIYVLVRPKKGKDPTTRIHEMLDEFVFERAHNENPKGIHKVVPVVGNMELPDLGLSLEDRKTLTSRVLRTMYMDLNKVADMVPVDLCVNAIIVSAYHTAKNFKENQTSNIPIYNFVSGAQSPVTWRQFIEYNMKYGFHNPTTKAVWYYGLNPTNNYYMFLFYNFFLHYLPALLLDVFSFLTGQRRKMLKFYSKVIKLAHILFYFSTQEWCFSDHGVRSMWSSLSDRDRAVFNFNMADMSWDYMAETFLLGLRVYLVKDDLSTLPEARKRWNRLYYMHQLLKITTFSVVLYLGYLLLTGLASMILG
ncbi:fatty-acyl CoA reductase 2, partial [Danaus plexippus plexippus]